MKKTKVAGFLPVCRSLKPMLHGIEAAGSHHKCGPEVSTVTGIKVMGSRVRVINVELTIMKNLFPNHCLYDPIRFGSTIRAPCVCQLFIKIQV